MTHYLIFSINFNLYGEKVKDLYDSENSNALNMLTTNQEGNENVND